MIHLKLKDIKSCTGCYACENICPNKCISMENDYEGFWYPKVDSNRCIKCGKCISVCPIVNKSIIKNNPIAYGCINKNENIRLQSSSGGLFTAIAEWVIENNGVVFGASFNNNFQVEHTYAETKEEIKKFKGSKYVQSRIGKTFNQSKRFLELGRVVLFTGTPCQINGLKCYLSKAYENLICIDIICHGVPSPEIWNKYLISHEEKSKSKINKVNFRHKHKGWKNYSVSIVFNNKTKYQKLYQMDPYMQAFLKNICLRPSCYDCKFKSLNRKSDITLADFWGVQRVLPEMDDDKGTSLIFANTKCGENILKYINDKIIYQEVDIKLATRYNSAAVKSANINPNRDNFFYEKDKLKFNVLVNKYCSDKFFTKLKIRLKQYLKLMLGCRGLLLIINKKNSRINNIID